MKPDRARLLRLRRLERMRAIAKQNAAMAAARAEGTLAQLEGLAGRSSALAAEYAARRDLRDGEALRQLAGFADGLRAIARGSASDAQVARAHADARLADLAEAERRRVAVEDRLVAARQTIARKALGTGLE